MPLATHPNPRLHIHDVNDTILYFEPTQRPPKTPIYPDNMVEKLLTFSVKLIVLDTQTF